MVKNFLPQNMMINLSELKIWGRGFHLQLYIYINVCMHYVHFVLHENNFLLTLASTLIVNN